MAIHCRAVKNSLRGTLALSSYVFPLCRGQSLPVPEVEFLNFSGDQRQSIPPPYGAWRAGTTTLFVVGSKLSPDCSKIPAELTGEGEYCTQIKTTAKKPWASSCIFSFLALDFLLHIGQKTI